MCRINSDGRRFRILTVLDDCTRQCMALVADTSLSGIRVARELDRLAIERGKPRMVVSDNATAEVDAGYRRRPPDTPIFHLIEIAHR